MSLSAQGEHRSETNEQPEKTAQLIGVDIGGTFTDLVAMHPTSGEVVLAKTPTVPGALEEGLDAGLTNLRGMTNDSFGEVRHGTTAVTNALVERRFARTALLCTSGFRDILETRRRWRQHLFGHDWNRPEALIERRFRFEVSERVGPDGQIILPLDEAGVREICEKLRTEEIESVGICFLFGFVNSAHEVRVAEILREEAPEISVSLASELIPEIHEYERTSTTAVNALVAPVVGRYLDVVGATLASRKVEGPLRMVRSDGLLMSPEVATKEPIRLIMSGPAAGVQGAVRLGQRLGWSNIITLDMGGTSTDVSLIWEGDALVASQSEIEWDIPVLSPQVDIATIGAGGGSIASLAPSGELKVGPRSAGAKPGPACYGHGGLEPTVTDALAVLGTFPTNLLGGDFNLDLEASMQALQRGIPVYEEAESAAEAIVFITLHKMALLIREATVNRGFDPRECTLFCFGGAGGVFAADLAKELGMPRAYVPPGASVFSALGASLSTVGYKMTASFFGRTEDIDVGSLATVIEGTERRASQALLDDGLPVESTRIEIYFKYRSQPQSMGVTIESDGSMTERLGAAIAQFHGQHERTFSMRREGEPVDIISVSCTAFGPDSGSWPLSSIRSHSDEDEARNAPRSWRRDGVEHQDVPVTSIERAKVEGRTLEGPWFLQDAFTTIAVPPGVCATTDELGGVTLEVGS